MLKALFVTCAIWIIGCSASQYTSNDYEARIAQDGLYNSVSILQLSDPNTAVLRQVGDDSRASILQTGDWDTATAQVGAVNTAVIGYWSSDNIGSQAPIIALNKALFEQFGSMNQCLQIQTGIGHSSIVNQTGNGNIATVNQTGIGNISMVTQATQGP